MSRKCACVHPDARDCFIGRHPECRRTSDDVGGLFDDAIEEECCCCCHVEDEDGRTEWDDELEEPKP